MSFIPFFSGKRICLGKTFSEHAFRTLVPILLNNHKFKFVNEEHLTKKPYYDGIMFKKPEIRMRLEKISS